jgi:NAD(P)-dependent dehydrogenase (short-subunit alcohol dehydrogenase family)
MEWILLTGANSGLGKATARRLVQDGQAVILGCRTHDKAVETRQQLLLDFPQANLKTAALELSSLGQVKDWVAGVDVPVYGLIGNAGVSYQAPTKYTEEGVEWTFGVNHLGHFALTLGLLHRFPESLKRILIVSSAVHDPAQSGGRFPPPDFKQVRDLAFPPEEESEDWDTIGSRRYVHSKLCNLWFTYELHRRLLAQGRTVCVNAFNPGFVPGTNLGRHGPAVARFLFKYVLPGLRWVTDQVHTPAQVAEAMEGAFWADESGYYWDRSEKGQSSALSHDESKARELWVLSVELTGLDL